MTGGFGQLHITLYHGLEHQLLEVTFHIAINLIGQTEARIIHCQEEPFNFKVWVQLRFNNSDGI